jgi:hypothetical protein
VVILSEQLKILITANLDIGKSEKELQRQLSDISKNLNLTIGIDSKQMESLSKQVNSIQQQISGTKVKIIKESDLKDTKSFLNNLKDINDVRKQFEKEGSLKISEDFDPVTGKAKAFNVEIQKSDGLVRKLKLELAELHGMHGIDKGFLVTKDQLVDNTTLQMEKALQQTVQKRYQEQKKANEEQDKAINKNIENTKKEQKEIERLINLLQQKKKIEVDNLRRRYGDAIDSNLVNRNLSQVMSANASSFSSLKEYRHWQDQIDVGFKQIGASARTSGSHVLTFGEAFQTAMVKEFAVLYSDM